MVLRVADSGPGVPDELKGRLFAPFQRLGDASGTGLGLGLAVADGLATAVGAELTAEDTPGGGLTMLVTVPLADASAPAGPDAAAPPPDAPPPSLRPGEGATL